MPASTAFGVTGSLCNVIAKLSIYAESQQDVIRTEGKLGHPIDLVGVFDSYAEAEDAWRGRAQRTVDDAEMKYVIVHLHRLLEPDGETPPSAVPKSNADVQAPR